MSKMMTKFYLDVNVVSINVVQLMVAWVFTGICISALRKSASLYFCTWSICFSFRETVLVLFLSLLCGSDYSF